MEWLPRSVRWLVAVCGACAVLSASRASRADALPLPKRGDTEAFVPPGWTLERSFDADLDADGEDDRVLVLLQSEPAAGSDRQRALVILLRRADAFELGGSNRGLLSCFRCNGVKGGDGAPELSVERGALLVSQISGSRWFATALDRFRWSRERKRFELIGVDTGNYDAATGEATETSCNLLTFECIETKTPSQVDAEGNIHEVPARTRRFRMKRALVPLDRAKNPLG